MVCTCQEILIVDQLTFVACCEETICALSLIQFVIYFVLFFSCLFGTFLYNSESQRVKEVRNYFI